MLNFELFKKKTSLIFDYSIININFERVLEMRDLGMIMDDKINFTAHIFQIVIRV